MASSPPSAGVPGRRRLPDWVGRLLRPVPAPVPWARALRAGLAVGAPLAGGMLGGDLPVGLLIAIGALVATITADRGGSYRTRAARVSLSGLGAAAGVLVGMLAHHHGWTEVAVVVAMAGCSAVLSSLGALLAGGALTFLVLGVIALGTDLPRPLWLPPLLIGAGAGWTLLLAVAGALRGRGSTPEREAVAAVYAGVAGLLRAAGTPAAEQARQALTAALDTAEDTLFSLRLRNPGRDRAADRLMVALEAAGGLVEAAVATLNQAAPGAPGAAEEASRVAQALRRGQLGMLSLEPAQPDPAGGGPAEGGPAEGGPAEGGPAGAVERALAQVHQALAEPGPSGRLDPSGRRGAASGAPPAPTSRPAGRSWLEPVLPGPLVWLAALRLMVCMGAAETLSLVLPLHHTYWIALTVAIVVQPDFGSVFARAVQRGLGTVVGVAIGAAVLAVVPHGLPIVAVAALLAAAMPVTIQRNYGMFATVLTPLVVVLIALLSGHPDQVALARVEDTLIGSAIVLVLGYALWPGTWRPALSGAVAQALDHVAAYAAAAAATGAGTGAGGASPAALRRRSYRELSNVRTTLQQLLAEPPPVSRQAARWWPAVIALERLADAVTAAAVSAGNGGSAQQRSAAQDPAPGPREAAAEGALSWLRDSLADLAAATRTGSAPAPRAPAPPEGLPGAALEVATLRTLLTQAGRG